jgi:hypothetical protein
MPREARGCDMHRAGAVHTGTCTAIVIEFYDLLNVCCFRPPLLGSSYQACGPGEGVGVGVDLKWISNTLILIDKIVLQADSLSAMHGS